ncbi:putative beta-farnesene synthase [Helianthus annuus]|nr:putative beta-farnesene synthase [Helianthus annuus]
MKELTSIFPGLLKKYVDEYQTFNMESLSNDAQGMLALYEASYMMFEGEQILEDALEFTKTHLPKIAMDPSCDSLLRTKIKQALNQPLRKSVQRLEVVRYIPIYQQQPTHNEVLLKLAKMDFNILQSIHKRELSQICKWWKDLDLQTKLPYARDRIIEGYYGLLAVSFEPQHSRSRIFLTKACAWILLLDDTYDNYATYEELEIFTEVVQRWSISCLDMLPEYMKLIYQELINIHQEMEESLEKEGRPYQIHYVKKLMKEFTRSLLVEAKWTKERYTPTSKEYMSNSLVTSTYPLIIGESYVGRGDNMVTEDSFKWAASHPPLVKAASSVIRLMDDIVTHKKEQERNHVASSIECYQKETGASEEEAYEYSLKQVEDAWKVINRESLRPTDVPFPLVNIIINLARLAHETYKHNDGLSDAGEEAINYVKSLLVHPMIV